MEDLLLTTWLMCDRCCRAFKSVELLVSHKESQHPPEPKTRTRSASALLPKSFPQILLSWNRNKQEQVESQTSQNDLMDMDVDIDPQKMDCVEGECSARSGSGDRNYDLSQDLKRFSGLPSASIPTSTDITRSGRRSSINSSDLKSKTLVKSYIEETVSEHSDHEATTTCKENVRVEKESPDAADFHVKKRRGRPSKASKLLRKDHENRSPSQNLLPSSASVSPTDLTASFLASAALIGIGGIVSENGDGDRGENVENELTPPETRISPSISTSTPSTSGRRKSGRIRTSISHPSAINNSPGTGKSTAPAPELDIVDEEPEPEARKKVKLGERKLKLGDVKSQQVTISPKQRANAFQVLLQSSLKLKLNANKNLSSSGSSVRYRPRTKSVAASKPTQKIENEDDSVTGVNPYKRNKSEKNGSLSETLPLFPCPQCHRNLETQELLKLHLKIHQAFIIEAKSLTGNPSSRRPIKQLVIPCNLCGRKLTLPPYKCIGCPSATIKVDIPSMMKIKVEPREVREEDADVSINSDPDFTDSTPPPPPDAFSSHHYENFENGTEGGRCSYSQIVQVELEDAQEESPVPVPVPVTGLVDSEDKELELEKQFPFACEICGKCYAEEDPLKIHVSLHLEKKRRIYKCKHCSKTYRSKRHYTGHVETHCV